MEEEKHLKSKQHYIDLYDRHTVDWCRTLERSAPEKESLPREGEESVTKEEVIRIKEYAAKFIVRLETGERYLNKEKTIKEWMDADQAKDELYESAQAPEGIRCLTCRNVMKPTFKYLWSDLDKPDKVLFMYDCPNQCLPRRMFFHDGEERRIKLDPCPQCEGALHEERVDDGKKLVTKSTCQKCGYAKTDEYEWNFNKKEELLDEKFAADRDRFCLTEEEGKKYQDEKWNMEKMGKLVDEWKGIEKDRAEKLKANPKGFHLEGAGYTCFICGGSTPEGDNWYDEWGIKCLVCQKAIDDGEIPASLAKDKDSWYSKHDLERSFNLKSPNIKKWVKEGILKARTVSHYGNGVHAQLFLLEDNKDLLPPKKLVKWQSVKEVRDGKTWHRSEPWYRFVDPKEHLKGYKIMDYLKVTKEEKPPE